MTTTALYPNDNYSIPKESITEAMAEAGESSEEQQADDDADGIEIDGPSYSDDDREELAILIKRFASE